MGNSGRHFKSPSPWSLSVAMALTIWLLPMVASAAGAQPPDRVTIRIPALREASGLAHSYQSNDLLWVHNDSGNAPVLYAIGTNGIERGSLRPIGAKNVDWEDIDSFELDGKFWLLIADVGDNLGIRKSVTIYIVAEPAPSDLSPDHETSVPIAWKLDFTYPDGPHDCEAVAADTRERAIYLLTKRTHPPRLFSLPLEPPAAPIILVATPCGEVTHLPQPTSEQRLFPTPNGRFRGQPTAMSFSPDGRTALVLTYGALLIFHRLPGQDWAKALAGQPELIASPGLPQEEGATFSLDGQWIYVTGEQKDPPLLRFSSKPGD